MASFCAVMMVKEDKPIIERVVDYYLDLGASRVVVFYDGDPDFEVDDRAGRLDFVHANEAFWHTMQGSRPDCHGRRQVALYRSVIDEMSEDWILFVDCDEFLVSSLPITTALGNVPEGVDILRVRNVEAICGPGDDREVDLGARWFRKRAQRE